MTSKIVFGANVLFAIAALSAAGAIPGPSHTAVDQSLMKYLMNSRFSNDPQVSVRCFGYFVPILNNITSEFSRSFQQCAVTEKDRIGKLNDAALKDRYQIELAADSVCVRLDACNDQPNPLDFFDCYSEQGSDDSKILYTVTQNSTEKAADLREQYHIVEVEKCKCQNASERVYVEDTAKTYEQLDLCLKTGDMPSTVSPETTTESSSTTKSDEETTIGSSSPSTITDDPSSSSTTTENGPEETTTVTTEEPQGDTSKGRGLKILSELRKFWRI